MDHGESCAYVIETSKRELTFFGYGCGPHLIVERSTFKRESDEPPAWVIAIGSHYFRRLVGRQGPLKHPWVAEQAIEFGKDELRNGYMFKLLDRTDPFIGNLMLGESRLRAWKRMLVSTDNMIHIPSFRDQ